MNALADFLGIVAIILGILFFIYPNTRRWLQKSLQKLFSPTCVGLILFGSLLILTLAALPATVRKVESLLATATPTPTATFVPTSTPTPNYTYLFFDNFNSGSQPSWMPVSGNWGMINDAYTLTDVFDKITWSEGLTFVGDVTWTDYQVGALVHLDNAQPRINVAFLIVRAQDSSNFLALALHDYDFLDSDWSRGRWYVVQNGQWQEKSPASFPIPLTTKFNVAVEVNQDIITTYIDGVQASRWENSPYLTGMVGIGVSSRYPTSPASFDNFYVITIPQ